MSGFIALSPPTNRAAASFIRICGTVESVIENAMEATTGGGDWEGDTTVHGLGGNWVTLVERKSGYLSAYPVKRRTRRQVTRAINLQFDGHVVHTLTLDNGKAFAGHERIAHKSGARCILLTRIRPVSALRMKIPMACSASISPKGATSAS